MYPISSAAKALFDSEQKQILRITGTDKNGVSISITDEDIVLGSFNIDRCSCNGEKLEVGTAIASEMTFKLDNFDGRYNSVVFEGTELFVEIGIADWTQDNPTVNWIPCGYFTPDEQPRSLKIITIHALDRMTRFDAVPPTLTPWTTQSGDVMTDSQGNIIYFVSNVQFPVTVQNLVKRVALLCGVPFTQSLSNFPNYIYTLSALPTLQQEITFRNIIQWCAGIIGANAWIDWTGSLRFSWYGATTGYTTTTANRFNSDLFEDDITLTGVTYTNTQGVSIVSGSADYAIDMTGNYLAAVGISTILPNVKNAINGFTYRPFTASVINAPYLWPMDMITFNKDGVNYVCAVTNVNFGINGTTELAGKGETAQVNSGTTPVGVTKEQGLLIEQAREATQQLDDSLNQEGIFNRLTNDGETQGLILYNGKVYLNASYIQTGTMVADFIKGGTLTLGYQSGISGSIRVLDTSGNLIGAWNSSGIMAKQGTINLDYNSLLKIGFASDDSEYAQFDKNGMYIALAAGSVIETSETVYIGQDGVVAPNNVTLGNLHMAYKTNLNTGWDGIITPTEIEFYRSLNGSMTNYVGMNLEKIYGYNSRNSCSLDINFTDKEMTFYGSMYINGGTKSRVVSTDQYADRALYCYETPSPLFGDVGEGIIGEDGKCYVWLDAIFADTISKTQYQVFLQKYGDGDCWIAERRGSCFVVEGTPGLSFGWELKAKQKDFDQLRLEKKTEPFIPQTTDYGADAAQYINEIRKERIPA